MSIYSSAIQGHEKYCYVSGVKSNLDRHHCLQGIHRKKAEKYGLWVWLAHDIHMGLHSKTPPWDKLDLELKRTAERTFLAKYGYDKWMDEFGVNYLDLTEQQIRIWYDDFDD